MKSWKIRNQKHSSDDQHLPRGMVNFFLHEQINQPLKENQIHLDTADAVLSLDSRFGKINHTILVALYHLRLESETDEKHFAGSGALKMKTPG